MKAYSSREIIKIITDDGWYEVDCRGDHHQFKHLSKPGKVTVPPPKKSIPIGTVKSILKQTGINI
jgi:predicted RNA binding protein YcfA (HicA-like mRNA interferase family)